MMRIISKGNYRMIIFAGLHVHQCAFRRWQPSATVEEYIAIDCADTYLKSDTSGHSVPALNQTAQSIVKAQAGTISLVLPPTARYPETDTDPAHQKWSQMARPQPGDLIVWDWPAMHGATFDHATIYVGTDGAGTTLRQMERPHYLRWLNVVPYRVRLPPQRHQRFRGL